MNNKFFDLPPERRNAMLNAAFRVFAQHGYAKASTALIAQAGGISKSLLFHYFTNKRELYLYLWSYAAQVTAQATQRAGALDTHDFFEVLQRTTHAKCQVMREFPYLFAFSCKAYYEQDPQVAPAIHQDVHGYTQRGENALVKLVDASTLRADVSVEELYRQFVMLSDGYLFQHYLAGTIDADAIERDFAAIISSWRRAYSADAAALTSAAAPETEAARKTAAARTTAAESSNASLTRCDSGS